MTDNKKIAWVAVVVSFVLIICGVVIVAGIRERAFKAGRDHGSQVTNDLRDAAERDKVNGAKYSYTIHFNDDGPTWASWVDGSHCSGGIHVDPKKDNWKWDVKFLNRPDEKYEFIIRRTDVSDRLEKLDDYLDIIRALEAAVSNFEREAKELMEATDG